MAFFAAQSCDNTVVPQDGLKFFLPRARWTRPIQAFDGVVWNEIDLGRETARNLRQLVGLLISVVDAGDKDVLESHPSFFRHIVIACFE